MTIEFLQERIAKAEEFIEKKENTITKKEAQIQKKLDKLSKLGISYNGEIQRTNELVADLGIDYETAYEIYDLEYSINSLEDSIQYLKSDIADKEKTLEEYRSKLDTEIEKANSRNIAVIIEFLEMWKERVTEYYHDEFEKYLVEKAQWYEVDHEYTEWRNYSAWNMRKENPEEYDRIIKEYDRKRKAFYSKWKFIFAYVNRNEFDDDQLKKDLDVEADHKYDFIIERTNAIVGTITDASNLYIGGKGDLNGIIIGDRGTARVTTIGAGGYNIQCYHFRTLIHREK